MLTDAFDFDLMVQTLQKMKEGKRVEVPVYDFTTHCRAKYTVRGLCMPPFALMGGSVCLCVCVICLCVFVCVCVCEGECVCVCVILILWPSST